ncbi:hypothetical protein BC332_30553 [Capsicum chinense]|nr:hypothetical protein BC332_30553 [Capsicum chinense]
MLLKVRKPTLEFPNELTDILREFQKLRVKIKVTKVICETPKEDWAKYNTDGAVRGGSGESSYAFFLRDVEGDLIYDKGALIEDTNSVQAEAIAILQEAKHFKQRQNNKFIYNNLRSIQEKVQRLDLLMNEGTKLNDLEFSFSRENFADRTGKWPAVDIHTHSNSEIQDFEDFSIVSPSKILRKTGLSTYISASQPTKGRKTTYFDAKTVEVTSNVNCDEVKSSIQYYNEEAITNIIKGLCIPTELPWYLVDEVYVPMNCNDKFHWVLVVIALKNRRIHVYDSLSKDKLSQRTQLVNQRPFEVEYVQNIMQQECDSLNCRVFVAGYTEYLSEGLDVPSVSFKAKHHRM